MITNRMITDPILDKKNPRAFFTNPIKSPILDNP